MRDIRSDLQERLTANAERRLAIKTRFDAEMRAIDNEDSNLKSLLAIEERRLTAVGALTRTSTQAIEINAIPLADFFVMQMQGTPRTKDELRQMGQDAGYFKGEESPARVTHTTLLNIVRVGRIRELPNVSFVSGPERPVLPPIPSLRVDSP
jgi:hypothetical protein